VDFRGLIDQIKTTVSIVDALEINGVEIISRSGDAWKAKCYMHPEVTPSLTISPTKGIYHCFSTGCEANGDVINFYQQFYHIDFKEALFRIADEFGIDASAYQQLTKEEVEKRRLIDVARAVSERLNRFLMEDPSAATARAYLKKRGVTDDTINAYKIGFMVDKVRIHRFIKECGGTDADGKSLELTVSSRHSGKLVYPCCDPRTGGGFYYFGHVGKVPDGAPKYAGVTGNHPLRWDGSMFGLSQLQASDAKRDGAILVEGFFDVLTLHSAGITNAVSLLGSSPSVAQLGVLQALHFNKVTLLLDGDKAGEAGVRKLVEGGTSGLSVRIASLPSGDPDEFVLTCGADAMRHLVAESIGLTDYVVGQYALLIESSSIEARVAAIKDVATFTRNLSLFERELIFRELGQRLGVTVESLLDVAVESLDEKKVVQAERSVLATCITKPELMEVAEAKFGSRSVWVLAKHGHIWRALQTLKKNKIVEYDEELLIGAMPEAMRAEMSGYVGMILRSSHRNFEHNMDLVRDAYLRRVLQSAGKSLSNSATDGTRGLQEILSQHLSDVSSRIIPASKIEFTAKEQVTSAMEYVHQRMESKGKFPGVNLGSKWKDLMGLTLGFQNSYLYLLSALPKVGKTTTMLNWATATAIEGQVPSLIINLEMSERDLALRIFSILSGVSNTRIRMGGIGTKEKSTLDEAAERYYSAPLYVVNASALTLHEVVNTMRKYVHTHGVEIIYLDYIQLIKNPGKQASWEKHQEISTELKASAIELNVPLVAVSQLSKAALEGGGAAHMGGAFKYLQDCDFAGELRRRTQDEMKEDPNGNLVLNAEYHRHGPQDVYIKLLFNHENMRCEEVG
jgi:DNA primase